MIVETGGSLCGTDQVCVAISSPGAQDRGS